MIARRISARAVSWFHSPMVIILTSAAMLQMAIAGSPLVFDTVSDNQLGLTFSPDGSTAFWVEWNGEWGSSNASQRIIYMSRRQQGAWNKPSPAPFTRSYSDDDPFVSPDGRWLYFVSERPADENDEESDADIWRYSLIEEDRLEHLSINSGAAEYSPVVTASGTLYFASGRDGGLGQGDLYQAAPKDDDFHPPERLSAALNSRTGEWNLWVSADDSEIVFEASSRPTNISAPGDLYYSWRTPSGWTAAMPVKGLNSRDSDLMPRLHPDGKTLYYTTAPIGEHAQIATVEWGPLRARARATYAPTLLVANKSSDEITLVDLSRSEVVTRKAPAECVSIGGKSFALRYQISLGDQSINKLIHPKRRLAYVSLPEQKAVAEINLDTGVELRRIPVGIEPDGLSWAGRDKECP